MNRLDRVESVSRIIGRLLLIGLGTFIALSIIVGVLGGVVGPTEITLMFLVAVAVPALVVVADRRRVLRVGVIVTAVVVGVVLLGSMRKPTTTTSTTCTHDDVVGQAVVVATGPGGGKRYECR